MPDHIAGSELDPALGNHVSVWLDWYRRGKDDKDEVSELVQAWKKKKLPIPGGTLWAHITPRGKAVHSRSSSSEISSNEAQKIVRDNGSSCYSCNIETLELTMLLRGLSGCFGSRFGIHIAR